MKNMELIYTGIKVRCRNAREESLVRIYNNDIEDYIRYMMDENNIIGQELLEITGITNNWVEQLHGMLSAMYYLNMLEKPFTQPHKEILDGYIKETGIVPMAYMVLYGEESEVSA